MNALATCSHLLRTDLRRFRVWIAVYLLVSIIAVLIERIVLPEALGRTVFTILRIGQIIGFAVITVWVFLVDSAADSRSQWLSRPIAPGSLWASKVAFIVVALWLPLMTLYLPAWAYDGFTARQTALAAAELTLYCAAVAALLGGIATASSHFPLVLAGLVQIVVLATACAWLSRFLTRDGGPGWSVSPGMQFLLICLVALASGAVCFVAVLRFRRKSLARLGLVLAGVSPLWLPAATELPPTQATFAHPVTLAAPGSAAARDETLFRNITLQGLPSNHFAVPIAGDFSFTGQDSTRVAFLLDALMTEHLDPAYDRYALPVIRAALPSGISILSDQSLDQIAFRTSISAPPNLDPTVPGHLRGNVQFMVYEAAYAGRMALEPGASVSDRGHVLQLTEARRNGGYLELRMNWMQPRLAFSSRLDDRANRHRNIHPLWLLVAVFPDSNEAQVSSANQHFMGGPFPITAHGFSQFRIEEAGYSGIGNTPPELHAFRIVAKGSQSHAFAWDDHLIDTALGFRSGQFAEAPANQPELTNHYASLDDLWSYTWDLPYPQQQAAEESVAAILAADIPGALARAPWQERVLQTLLPVLDEHLTEDHLPAFRAALERDPRLIRTVEQRQWGEHFRDYVTKQLALHNPLAEPALVRLAAAMRDPALYPHLHWHFVHGQQISKADLYASLAALPDFDTRSMLDEAWTRARLGGNPRSLCQPALENGLPGALEAAVRYLYDEGIVANANSSGILDDLLQATRFPGPWQSFYPWIERHAAELGFDPQRGYYRTAE